MEIDLNSNPTSWQVLLYSPVKKYLLLFQKSALSFALPGPSALRCLEGIVVFAAPADHGAPKCSLPSPDVVFEGCSTVATVENGWQFDEHCLCRSFFARCNSHVRSQVVFYHLACQIIVFLQVADTQPGDSHQSVSLKKYQSPTEIVLKGLGWSNSDPPVVASDTNQC